MITATDWWVGLVILSMSLPKVNKAPYVLLLVWAIPFAPLVQIPQFRVYEDVIMFVIGIYASFMLFFRRGTAVHVE